MQPLSEFPSNPVNSLRPLLQHTIAASKRKITVKMPVKQPVVNQKSSLHSLNLLYSLLLLRNFQYSSSSLTHCKQLLVKWSLLRTRLFFLKVRPRPQQQQPQLCCKTLVARWLRAAQKLSIFRLCFGIGLRALPSEFHLPCLRGRQGGRMITRPLLLLQRTSPEVI